MNRRLFLGTMGALSTLGAPALVRAADKPVAHVVVVGAGFGGATAAKYLRLFSEGRVAVTLIDPNPAFVSCPISNLVLEGRYTIDDVTRPYDGLASHHGITRVQDTVTAIDADARTVTLSGGDTLAWDRLIVSPGIDFMWERIPGMNSESAQEQILHGWKPGAQTVGLRKQLEAMPDGGRYIIAVPEAPYRCPPAPYERASLVASYFSKHKPRSKVHIFDANQDVTSKAGLFKAAWQELYPDIVEYIPSFKAVDVDPAQRKVIFELGEEETADVLNFVPPMRAGNLARDAGLVTANDRWCEVDFLTFESVAVPGVHVLGDAIQIAPGMPKSGHMANQHGKTCAAAVAAMLLDRPVNADPIYSNTCFSFVSDRLAMHVASVHRYDHDKKTMLTVDGSGGVSATSTQTEGDHAISWSRAIWSDILT
ncbi:MAG TPA: NAD(P)/FAD-dependent oxidoreductase [Burkholderiaceae bacterium]|nr:NAD(P)/FAD-dependent oxidoreductase [Burkholderiaceae bacterium]